MSTSLKTATPPRRQLKSADLDELKQQQLDATATEDGKGDIEHLKGKSYEFPAHESHLVHVALIRYSRKSPTSDLEADTKIAKLSPQEFERMEKNNSFAEYQGDDGAVQIMYDSRPKPRQVADKTGDVETGSPAEPNKPLSSLNDAQMRYFELTKEVAPADKTRGQLIDIIDELETKLKAEKTTPNSEEIKKPLRIKADYVARFIELGGTPEQAEGRTIDELKEAIAHFEQGEA
jgi:hypothetical protein